MLMAVDAAHAALLTGSGAAASTSPRSRRARQNPGGTGCENMAAQLRASAPVTQPATTLAMAGCPERKLQRRGLQRHGEFRAQRFEQAHAFEHRGGRGGVVVVGLRAGAGTGGENSRIERPAADDRHISFDAQRQQLRERRLLEQRVTAGKQQAIELAVREQLDANLPLVHADADGAHGAGIAQLAHRAISAAQEFRDTRGVRLTVCHAADVMAQQDVHARHTQALEALGVRTHDRVVAIVEHRRERARREIALASDVRILRAGGHEPAADLGRDHRRRLRAAQRAAEAQLAQAESVERRGVEVAHAAA